MNELWTETLGMPDAVRATLERSDGFTEARDLLLAPGVRRIVATGNGAAFYAAMALWVASLRAPSDRVEVVAVPAGLVAAGAFSWRPGDRLLAISTSGELRDLVEILGSDAPRPYAAITAAPDSTVGRAAAARALIVVPRQEAVTHSQAYCGNVAAVLRMWALIRDDAEHDRVVRGAPEAAARALDATERWSPTVLASIRPPRAAVVFGGGLGWPAALEAALLLKEVARVPAEGLETREGATSGMYSLRQGDLAVSIRTAGDRFADETERVCRDAGATAVALPGVVDEHPLLAPITSFPAAVGLAIALARRAGHDVDRPGWLAAYQRTARRATG